MMYLASALALTVVAAATVAVAPSGHARRCPPSIGRADLLMYPEPPVPSSLRRAAVRWVRNAVTRSDLAGAWRQAAPALRRDVTRRQWLSGHLPVLYYPAAGVRVLGVGRQKSLTLLYVRLRPTPWPEISPQRFWIGLERSPAGRDWRIAYFAPSHGPFPPPADC